MYSVGMMPYESITAWQVAHELVLAVYRVTAGYPKHELYGVTSQTRRAAFSVAANIAEGAAKKSKRDFARYLDISLGSLSEVSYALRLARDLGYVASADWSTVDQKSNRAGILDRKSTS